MASTAQNNFMSGVTARNKKAPVIKQPVYGPPSPVTPSQPLDTLTYKTFLNGRQSTRDAAIQYAKLTKNASLLKRLTTPSAPPGAAPAPSAPTAPIDGTAPLTAGPAPQMSTPALSAVPPQPDVSKFTSAGELPMPKNVPVADINSLYAPAERAIASQRAAALAAQNKAFQDNLAFEQFIQGATGQANQALAGTLGQLSQGAATSRQQSIDNLNAAIQNMQAGAGGSSDLARLAGSTAAGQSNQLLQAGQSALNAVPDIVGQAALTYGQGQGQVGAAQGRVMNDQAIRATQAALGDIGQQQTELETKKATGTLQQQSSIRDYMVQAAQLQALQNFNAGKLTEQGYASATNLMGKIAVANSRVDVENIRAQVTKLQTQGKLDVATANNLNKLAVQRMKEVGATNRTLLSAAAKRQASGTTFGSKGVDYINSTLRNQTKDIKSQNRYERGQTVREIATGLKNKFVLGQSKPMTYQEARSLLSGIPQAGPEALRDPAFDAFLKGQFPQ